MISGSNTSFRKAVLADLNEIKALADQHRTELGFVLRPSLEKSIDDHELIVALVDGVIVTFVHYHHRRDGQTTLYHITVRADQRGRGVGAGLVARLREEAATAGKQWIQLKCPVSLASNVFYARTGFEFIGTETGKVRPLNVWRLSLALS